MYTGKARRALCGPVVCVCVCVCVLTVCSGVRCADGCARRTPNTAEAAGCRMPRLPVGAALELERWVEVEVEVR